MSAESATAAIFLTVLFIKYFSSLIRNTLAPKSVKVYVDSLAPKSAKVNRENVFCSSVTKRRRHFSA